MKIALLFFLLITHGCGAPASLATQHTTVCLDHGCSVPAWTTRHTTMCLDWVDRLSTQFS